MRRLIVGTCVLALAASVGIWPSGAPAGATGVPFSTEETSTTTETTAEDTSTTTSTTTTVAPTSTMAPASRGTAVQAVTTLPPPTTPPPPTTAAPAPSPYPAPPANSGSGRRVVYSKQQMRVWIIEADGTVVRSYRVSGRYAQPSQGTFFVFSRSAFTCHKGNPHVCMRYMVRFTRGPSGDNIGFHEIPRRDGVPMQRDSQLGQALSAGCVRQSTADAQFMWAWAYIGTKVVVVW